MGVHDATLGSSRSRERTKVKESQRGRHGELTRLWREWGEDNGYLPMTPRPPKEPGIVTKLLRAIGL